MIRDHPISASASAGYVATRCVRFCNHALWHDPLHPLRGTIFAKVSALRKATVRKLKAHVESVEIGLLDEAVVFAKKSGGVAEFFPDSEGVEFARRHKRFVSASAGRVGES